MWLGPFGFQSDGPEGDAPAPRGGRSVREPQFMPPPPAGRTRGPAGHASANNARLRQFLAE